MTLSYGARKPLGDRIFKQLTAVFAGMILLLALAMLLELWQAASPSFNAMGWRFFVEQGWDPVMERFGALAFVYGTLISSFIALLLAAPFGIGVALFLTEIAPRSLREPVSFLVEILAAIPSVVYGLWGIFALAPFMRSHVDPFLIACVGKPFFASPSTGLSLLTAGIILSIMILPTIMGVSREVFRTIPRGTREAALALGATRWEAIRVSVLLPSRGGLLGAILLGIGRALGETMAVTMVIGNRPEISANLLGPSHTIAAVIANEFAEATSDIHLSALAELGLVLMGITIFINIAARVLVWSTSASMGATGGGS
ncbi:MAG TPA: phosphate ABC transporter permease subunit PstC [Fibrobacteria bacterium]|nr:phosphate ABC transporter permease subunit PstC [Fibrobacteria bacterium]